MEEQKSGQGVQLQTKIANTVFARLRHITSRNTLSKYSVNHKKITYVFLHLEALILYLTC